MKKLFLFNRREKMESKIELIFNTFLIDIVQGILRKKKSGLDEEKVKTIMRKKYPEA